MLSEIEIKKISEDNFNRYSLLSFSRHQEVKECWRKRGGEWIYLLIQSKLLLTKGKTDEL